MCGAVGVNRTDQVVGICGHLERAGKQIFVAGWKVVDRTLGLDGTGRRPQNGAVASDDDQCLLMGQEFGRQWCLVANLQSFDGNAVFLKTGRRLVGTRFSFSRARFRIMEEKD